MTSSPRRPAPDLPVPPGLTGQPTIRLRGPAQLLASMPLLIGFAPRESIVAIGITDDPRARLGMTLRMDLTMEQDISALIDEVGTRMIHSGAHRVVAVLYPLDELGWTPEALLAEAAVENMLQGVAPMALLLEERLAAEGVALDDLLVVVGDRFWSAICADQTCCPWPGKQISPAERSAPVTRLIAENAALGRAPVADRDALVASIAAPKGADRKAVLRAQRAAAQRRDTDLLRRGDDARLAALDRFAVALRTFSDAPGEPLGDPDGVADLVVWLRDTEVRDAVTAWVVGRDAAQVVAFVTRLASRAVHPHVAPVCSVLAWMALCQGEGALANVAVDRALRSEAHYSMARLALESITRQLPPEVMRQVLETTAPDAPSARLPQAG